MDTGIVVKRDGHCHCRYQQREGITLKIAQLEAVTHEPKSLRTALAQIGARTGVRLVDTKLLTKPNVHSGEHEENERWTTSSVMMRACCAAMTPTLGELMESASRQELEIRQDAMTLAEEAHNTNLYYFLSLLTDDETLDIVQKQSGEQYNGGVVSSGDAQANESTFQTPRSTAGDLVPEMEHSWRKRETAAESLGKPGARVRATERRRDL